MPTLRSLLGGYALALRALGELSWLMDVDVVDVQLAEQVQLIMIQMIATVLSYEKDTRHGIHAPPSTCHATSSQCQHGRLLAY